MHGVIDTWCTGCHYLNINSLCCDYYILTGFRRPCKAGQGCTVRETPKKVAPDKRLEMLEAQTIENNKPKPKPKPPKPLPVEPEKGPPKYQRRDRETVMEMNRVKREREARHREQAMKDPEQIAQMNAIKEFRKQNGLTQWQLGKLIGASGCMIWHWETGTYAPNWEKLELVGCKKPGGGAK